MHWNDILDQRRWFPVGRPTDAKAPAPGFKTDNPACWLGYDDVQTPMAGLNFGPVDGLVGLDLDYKPGEGTADEAALAMRRLGEIRRGLVDLGLTGELSHSGKGMHFFAEADGALLTALRGNARVKVRLVAGRARRDVAAVELFGGGNAYIAVTGRWTDYDPPDTLPVLTLAALRSLLPEWEQQVMAGPGASPPPSVQPGLSAPSPAVNADDAMRARQLLACLPVPGDYDSWLDAVSAFKTAGVSMEEVERWSSFGPNYRTGEVARKWGHTLREPSMGWLVSYAQHCGVAVPRSQYGGGGQAAAPVVVNGLDRDDVRRRLAAADAADAAGPPPGAYAALAELSAEFAPVVEDAVPMQTPNPAIDGVWVDDDDNVDILSTLAAWDADDARHIPDAGWPARNAAAVAERLASADDARPARCVVCDGPALVTAHQTCDACLDAFRALMVGHWADAAPDFAFAD